MLNFAKIPLGALLTLFMVAACMHTRDDLTQSTCAELKYELEYARQTLVMQENRYRALDAEKTSLQQQKTDLSKNLVTLQQQNNYLQKMNRQLYDNVVELEKEMAYKKSLIDIQDEVIKLLDDPNNTIASSLKNRMTDDAVEVVTTEKGFKVIILEKILYDSGSYEINPQGRQLLSLLAQTLNQSRNQDIVVEGHTDNLPLKTALKIPAPSNWELSAVRASKVARILQEEGIDPGRLSAKGYSHYAPIAPNDTEDGRRQNRRIEILLSDPN